MNTLKTWVLMGALSALMVVLGNAIGGKTGAFVFFALSLAMNFFSYYYSDKLVISMTGARALSQSEAPELHFMVRKLTEKAGLPMPRLYITPEPQPNAFATGRNPQHAAIAVTEGLLQILNKDEIEGVLAHEVAHIKNRDILIGTMAAALAGAISMIANIAQWGAILGGLNRDDEEGGAGFVGSIVMAIVAPIAAMIIQMAISRSREYLADETGAQLTGNPQGLANALLKLEQAASRLPMHVNPSVSHMFIVNPLSGEFIMRLFSTHPSISDRVRRLQSMIVR